MPSEIRPLQSIVHLAIDLGNNYISGLDYFNPEYAQKLPPAIDAFSDALHKFDLPTIWAVRAKEDLYCLPATPENISLIPPDCGLLTTPNANDWISTKIIADALSNPVLREKLVKWDTRCVIVSGLSLEACIADTAMHLLHMGIDCLVPLDLVAAYMGQAPYDSPQFREWNQTAITTIMEKAQKTLPMHGSLALTTTKEILDLLQKTKGPAHKEPAPVRIRQVG